MHAWAATPCARTHSRRRRAGIHKAGQCRYTTPRTDTQVEQGCIAHLSQANAPSHALAHDATHPHAHRLHPSPKPSTARAHRQTTSRDDAAHTCARAADDAACTHRPGRPGHLLCRPKYAHAYAHDAAHADRRARLGRCTGSVRHGGTRCSNTGKRRHVYTHNPPAKQRHIADSAVHAHRQTMSRAHRQPEDLR